MSTNNEYDSEEQYSFLEEKIKEERFNIRKIRNQALKLLAMGLVFGIAACIGFYMLKPWAQSVFQGQPQEIEIPEDEDTLSGEALQEQVQIVQPELTIADYEKLNVSVRQVVNTAQKSMVTVTDSQTDDSRTAGVIVADNGQELLIVVNTLLLGNGQEYKVKFIDDVLYPAVIKQSCNNLNIGVLSVNKADISESTWSSIQVAELGNSNIFSQGGTLIALGNLYGYEDGVAYGIASSVNQSVCFADGEYGILVTDITGNENSSGILFDIDGKVVGILMNRVAEKTQSRVLAAYGISALKREIEMMSNGKAVPYIGIIGTVVTEKIAEATGMPKGLYVTEVEAESPAMKAGIQNGDIITGIGDEDIFSLAGYRNAMIEKEQGSSVQLKGQRYGAESYVEIGFDVTIDRK